MTGVTEIETLAGVVLAGLDADEAKARAVTLPPEWHQGSDVDDDWADDELLCWWPPEFHTPYEQDKHWRGETISGPENVAHMATWDPKRVLADVASKRAMLDLLLAEKHHDWPGLSACAFARFPTTDSCTCGRDTRVTAYLTLLAQPYTEAT